MEGSIYNIQIGGLVFLNSRPLAHLWVKILVNYFMVHYNVLLRLNYGRSRPLTAQ